MAKLASRAARSTHRRCAASASTTRKLCSGSFALAAELEDEPCSSWRAAAAPAPPASSRAKGCVECAGGRVARDMRTPRCGPRREARKRGYAKARCGQDNTRRGPLQERRDSDCKPKAAPSPVVSAATLEKAAATAPRRTPDRYRLPRLPTSLGPCLRRALLIRSPRTCSIGEKACPKP